MGKLDFMAIFDLIVAVLGGYLVFVGVKCNKEGSLHTMLITADEQNRCNDIKGFSKFIMPKTIAFGGACVLFGVLAFLDDFEMIPFPKIVNTIMLIAFLLVWGLYSVCIYKGKKKYIN